MEYILETWSRSREPRGVNVNKMGIPVLKIFNFALSVTPKSGFPILDSDLLIASVSDENSVHVIKSL